ncbi:hypothetical protein HK405_005761 [Cladochytrium tenue]|nr:hypothetical protein HK405_005761 [Cladochytrium tenue]
MARARLPATAAAGSFTRLVSEPVSSSAATAAGAVGTIATTTSATSTASPPTSPVSMRRSRTASMLVASAADAHGPNMTRDRTMSLYHAHPVNTAGQMSHQQFVW